MTIAQSNPLKLLYDASWKMVRRNRRLMELVKPGNQIEFKKAVELKEATSHADFPELALFITGGNADFQSTSSMSAMTKMLSWQVTTSNLVIDSYNEISWELYRSLLQWDTILCSLYWPNNDFITHNFVKKCTTINIDEGLNIDQNSRELKGWTGILGMEVLMMFSTPKLRLTDDEIIDVEF